VVKISRTKLPLERHVTVYAFGPSTLPFRLYPVDALNVAVWLNFMELIFPPAEAIVPLSAFARPPQMIFWHTFVCVSCEFSWHDMVNFFFISLVVPSVEYPSSQVYTTISGYVTLSSGALATAFATFGGLPHFTGTQVCAPVRLPSALHVTSKLAFGMNL